MRSPRSRPAATAGGRWASGGRWSGGRCSPPPSLKSSPPLAPLILVPSISYLLLRNPSLYEKQQISRIASPAHLTEFARGMLEKIRVHEAVREQAITRIPGEPPFGDLGETAR